MEKVSVTSLNVKNLRSNFLYPDYLASISNICYFNELWLKNNQVNYLKDICLNKNKNLLFESDMTGNCKGRPFGGQSWLIDRSFEIVDYKFLSRHVSFVHIRKNNTDLVIIGCYMPFENQKKKLESKSNFELSLNLVASIITINETNDIPCFVVGDFNADFNRDRTFDKIFKKFVEDYDLLILLNHFPQQLNFTFYHYNNGVKHTHWLDHTLFKPNSQNLITVTNCSIQDDAANMSDHNAILLELRIPRSNNVTEQVIRERDPAINFSDEQICTFFNQEVERLLGITPEILPNSNNQDKINYKYNYIKLIMSEARNNTINYSKFLAPRHDFNVNKNNKKWFTPELKQIKYEIMRLKSLNRNSYQTKVLKKKFRQIQRQNIYLIELKEMNKFENFARNTNKDKFWKFINSRKKKHSNDKEPSIPANKLLSHYSNFFFEKNYILNNEQTEIKNKVKSLFNEYKLPDNPPLFKESELDIILKKLTKSNVQGDDAINYSMLIHAKGERFRHLLLEFYNSFITLSVIPKNFNRSIIKPILKDQKKSTNDTNNIRPLSISNCLAQIFEKLILFNSPNLHYIHKNQFGFKRSTSCNHAIFTLKETIIRYVENKSSCKIASLDAEKAFDKIWRDGLFFKLYNKINQTFWFLLKQFYDSSTGIIPSDDDTNPLTFNINCGVKQGGILSPFLFNLFIHDLIEECIEAKIGAIFKKMNISIIVYADDIILISPVDCHLQQLLNICNNYSNKWLIKFNSSKSNIMQFGVPIFKNTQFFLGNNTVEYTDKIKYLGVEINNNLDFDTVATEKFKNVSKSILSLSHLGLTPSGLNPELKSFLYKTYCLSQFTYSLETTTLKTVTRDYLNISQNNLIRQFVGINKFSHMTEVLKCLKIFNFNDLYIKAKLSFLNSLKYNELSMYIFNFLCEELNETTKKSKSFKKDIILLKARFSMDIEVILAGASVLKTTLKDTFKERDGLTDSVLLCLRNIKISRFKKQLNDLIRPSFLTEYIEQMNEILG